MSQPAIVSLASERRELASAASPVIPPTTTSVTPIPSAMIATISSAAPSPRGTRWLVQPGDQRRGDGGDDPRGEQREHDHLREREQPHHPDEEQRDADQQPGREPDVAQPLRDDEDVGQLARVDLDLFIGLAAGFAVLMAASQAASDHVRRSVEAGSDCAIAPSG